MRWRRQMAAVLPLLLDYAPDTMGTTDAASVLDPVSNKIGAVTI